MTDWEASSAHFIALREVENGDTRVRIWLADAAGVRDAYGIPAAHVVGLSMGGALAQLLALDFPDRVLSLVLISMSIAVGRDRALPPSSAELRAFLATVEVDWSDPTSVVEYLVEYLHSLAGAGRRSTGQRSASARVAMSSICR